ncbi:response regulator [Paenibacillus sp. FSL H8-0034]|uniref:response regulator n=1 Tax=Paenibacillus sp. FSL H8-0034 TaxID=2954671 RepID=UPI0030F5B259
MTTFKILIADDEELEREALSRILTKGLNDIEIVGLAHNGRMAVELAEQHRPDVILLDIKMPGVDGLQAAQIIRSTDRDVKIIMVTAFDSFDYAQQALRLQVSDYMLKPSKSSVILETVGQVLKELEGERENRQRQLRVVERLDKLLPVLEADYVTQLLYDSVHESHLQEMMSLLEWKEQGPAFVMVCTIQTEGDDASLPAVYKSLTEYFRTTSDGWVGKLSFNQLPIIVLADVQQSYRAQSTSLIRKLLNYVSCFRGVRVFIGIGSCSESTHDIRQSYHEALLASTDLSIPTHCRHYSDLLQEDNRSALRSSETEKEVLEQARRGQWHEVNRLLQQWINGFEAESCRLVEAQQRVQDLLLILSRFTLELGAKTEKPYYAFQMVSYAQLRSELLRIVDGIVRSVKEMQSQVEPDLMLKVKAYIIQHAQREISLDLIAEHVQVSPFYISRLFKETFGTNYVDFLTERRIDKAKGLMSDEGKSLKEIAYEVGYHDPNYFSRVFKRTVGQSPTDYRKDLLTRHRPLSTNHESV